MPTARKFSTHGVYNGLPNCLPSVDVSGFDYWTTASGYNKDSVGAVTQSQIDQSLVLVGKLFWNLYNVTVDINNGFDSISNLFVTGFTNGVEIDSIQPDERVCSGSLSTVLNVDSQGQIDLRESFGFVRMYNGATTEDNFIGYGARLIDFAGEQSTISARTGDGFVDNVSVELGGYSQTNVTTATQLYEYVEVEGISFLFFGFSDASGSGFDEAVSSDDLSATIKDGASVELISQITGLGFWTY